MKRTLGSVFCLLAIAVTLGAQAPAGVDPATISRIRGEAITRSQAMETHWWLSEVYGPRPTGTPAYQQGADWVMKKFGEWGLQNIHIERFPFGQGWTIERFSIHMTAPQTASLVGQPRWNSPSTNGAVAAGAGSFIASAQSPSFICSTTRPSSIRTGRTRWLITILPRSCPLYFSRSASVVACR